MTKVIIFGIEKMAELAYHYFSKDSDITPVAFTVNREYIKEKEFLGLPLVAFEDIKKKYPPKEFKMFVAIGYTKLNKIRREKYLEAKKKGYGFVSYVSSKVISFDKIITGENCFILENQVIQTNVRFGNNVFVWSGNHFGHDVFVDDHTWVASQVVISGNVKIGKSCFIGINSTIRDGVNIGSGCLLGAGTIILKNTKDKEVYIEKQTAKYPIDSERFMKMTDISK